MNVKYVELGAKARLHMEACDESLRNNNRDGKSHHYFRSACNRHQVASSVP